MPRQLKPISEMDDEEIIAHYGVPGMKWGVIRKRARSYKATVESDTSKLRFLASKPIRDRISKALGRNKTPDQIRKERDAHLGEYESAAKKVESKGATKVVKIKKERDAHLQDYEDAAAKKDKKAETEKSVGALFVQKGIQNADQAYASRHMGLAQKRAKKNEDSAKAIRDEASQVKKDWDASISKQENKTKSDAKAIRDEASQVKKDWDTAILKAEKKQGAKHEQVMDSEDIGMRFVEEFVSNNRSTHIN